MKTPFTIEQFFSVFEKYNAAFFPLQFVFVLLALACLVLINSAWKFKNRFIGSFLGLMWIWMGAAYHILYFSAINKAAIVFGIFFILEGLIILKNTWISRTLEFPATGRLRQYAAYFFILFGLMIYPVIGYLQHMSDSEIISLGLPCPTTICTFGFFMLTTGRFNKYLLLIPTLWSLIGLSAAINFGVYQDFMLIFSAIVANLFILPKSRYNVTVNPVVKGNPMP